MIFSILTSYKLLFSTFGFWLLMHKEEWNLRKDGLNMMAFTVQCRLKFVNVYMFVNIFTCKRVHGPSSSIKDIRMKHIYVTSGQNSPNTVNKFQFKKKESCDMWSDFTQICSLFRRISFFHFENLHIFIESTSSYIMVDIGCVAKIETSNLMLKVRSI